MRGTLVAILASAAVVSATGCVQNTIEELVERTSCGCSEKITRCLRSDADLYRLDHIQDCFKEGGCDLADAIVGATWFASECHQQAVEDVREDLRRRADSTDTTTTTAESTTAKTTTAKTTTAKTTSTTAEATTTSTTSSESTTAATTSTTASTTASSTLSTSTTASSTTSTSSTSATTTGSATAVTTTGSLVCSTTTTKSTSICSTASGAKTKTCQATTTAISSCAPGNICFTSTAGADVCMKKDNSLTPSGLAVTITFAVAIVAAFAGVIISAVRAKSKAKKDAVARQMQLSSKVADVETANPFERSEANLPLIDNGHGGYGGQQDYSYGTENTGLPGEHGAAAGGPPKLHPGLGALGQDTHY